MKSTTDAKDVSILAALADPIRLAIVKRLSKVQEITGVELAKRLGWLGGQIQSFGESLDLAERELDRFKTREAIAQLAKSDVIDVIGRLEWIQQGDVRRHACRS